MMKMLEIEDIKKQVIPICKKYGVDKAYLFGSYARGEATKASDVDIRIDKGEIRGFKFGGFYVEVEEKLNCTVDILTTKQLNKEFLNHIKKEEILIYDRGR